MSFAKYAALFTILAATSTVTGCAFEDGTSDVIVTPEPSVHPVDPIRIVDQRATLTLSSTKNLDRIGEVVARRPEVTFHLNVVTTGWTTTDFELLRAFLAAHANVDVTFADAK
jgi:hypothetical protein